MGIREFLVDPAVDFVFPPVCPACGLDVTDLRALACPSCLARLRRVKEGEADFNAARRRLCEDGVIDDCRTIWYFEREGPLQSLLHLLKYSGRMSLGRKLGEELGRVIADHDGRIDMLVPVPLHAVKLRERGFNQSMVIAEGVAATTGLPISPDVLRRVKFTATQTRLSIMERAANVAGAFRVPAAGRRALDGQRVLLVDDVLTTGATVRECALALREAGISGVKVATVALARTESGNQPIS